MHAGPDTTDTGGNSISCHDEAAHAQPALRSCTRMHVNRRVMGVQEGFDRALEGVRNIFKMEVDFWQMAMDC